MINALKNVNSDPANYPVMCDKIEDRMSRSISGPILIPRNRPPTAAHSRLIVIH